VGNLLTAQIHFKQAYKFYKNFNRKDLNVDRF